jgi:hypothetical protein
MHHRDNPSLVQQFSAGMRMQVLPGDTLTLSKSSLPQATEIKVLQPRGAMSYQ